MASLQNLKKHLQSIRTTGQLAGAMKTVSAAKYSKISALQASYASYASAARELRERFGDAFQAALPCANPEAPDCFVILSSNRGLCGGYHAELFSYTAKLLREHDRPYVSVTCGKMAEHWFAAKKLAVSRAYPLPDVPAYGDVRELAEDLLTGYREGEIASVRLVYQHFQNMLTQTPGVDVLLPFGAAEAGDPVASDPLCLPDRDTVARAAGLTCYRSGIYAAVLEAVSGAQAATMMAMRAAYDNAEDSSALLESELSRRRQSEVTAGVIETSVDNHSFE